MKKIVFIALLLIFNSYLYANRQEELSEIKSLIDFEEEIARTFENRLKTMNIENSKLPISFTFVNSAKKSADITLSKNNLQISFNLKDEYSANSELKEFYSSSKFRDRTFVSDDKIYINIKDDFAKHIFDLLKYVKKDKIEKCEIKNNSNNKVAVCIYNNQIYINYIQNHTKYINSFDLVYHIDNFKNGPFVFQDKDEYITKGNKKDLLSIFPKGSIFFIDDATTLKYINIDSELKEFK